MSDEQLNGLRSPIEFLHPEAGAATAGDPRI